MTLDDYAALGGHMDQVRDVAGSLRQDGGRKRLARGRRQSLAAARRSLERMRAAPVARMLDRAGCICRTARST